MSPDFAEYAKNRLEDKPLVKGDVVPIAMFGYAFNFIVVQVVPHGVVRVTKTTEVVVKTEPFGIAGQDRGGALRGHRRPQERDTEDKGDGRAAA